jgi:hypothetical protein
MEPRDPSLDVLLDLDGQVREAQDHRHRLRAIKAYDYRDAGTPRRCCAISGSWWTACCARGE